ncbi:hypothetical protein PPERSA_11295 [Pseudocohnilembus persalinus]|uniref:Serine aminopeptidase S33 domain-containing protein n=1 Tax=Pseudocohnilembus persalinus TaxID=266149 RepID=A0A0V0QPI3_PSEPJ|nr:hypothetical protein PPERSA_11295 [Pseudocohnilembus persalinus]|eukprot:KRX04171.1 hypothetical protein PPERSA_11295 [Pseudocohnilembus persalinus]
MNLPFGTIAYKEFEPKETNKDLEQSQQPIIVYFHDVLGSVSQFKDFPQQLSNSTGLKSMVFDRLGFGQSEELDFYSKDKEWRKKYLKMYAWDHTPQILDEYSKYILKNEDQKYIIYGHSDGATIALLFAALQGGIEKSVGLITEAPHAYVDEQTTKGLQEARQKFKENNWIEKLKKYQGDRAQMLFDYWLDTWLDNEYAASWNIIQDIRGKIKVPHLITHGDKDNFATIDQIKEIRDSNEQSIVSIVEDCGHFPHKEKNEKMIELYSSFIKDEILSKIKRDAL